MFEHTASTDTAVYQL